MIKNNLKNIRKPNPLKLKSTKMYYRNRKAKNVKFDTNIKQRTTFRYVLTQLAHFDIRQIAFPQKSKKSNKSKKILKNTLGEMEVPMHWPPLPRASPLKRNIESQVNMKIHDNQWKSIKFYENL